MKILLSPDDNTDGGTPAPVVDPPPPTPAPAPAPAPAPTPAPGPASPKPTAGAGPAAVVVVTGTKSERELALEKEAEDLRRAVKERETAFCELQDKHENYRKSVEQTPAPKKKKIGVGFFETDEDEEAAP